MRNLSTQQKAKQVLAYLLNNLHSIEHLGTHLVVFLERSNGDIRDTLVPQSEWEKIAEQWEPWMDPKGPTK